ncbi:MAG: FAD-dependent oxidoreductase [Planctomycetes bacterium]|nr:FAD-dependent oxidoreductase [Planctomycetota bacterium]
MKTDILIVGGSAAGLAGAITARRFYPELKITVVRREDKALVPCGIPYIFGTLGSVDKNVIPDKVLEKNNLDLLVDQVISINKAARIARTAGGESIKYEKMILATGSEPLAPPLEGVEFDNVFTARKDPKYLQKLAEALQKARNVVVIGGGFIGLEFADELSKLDYLDSVSLVEMLPHCLLLACDSEICVKVEREIENAGVSILSDRKAKAILGEGKAEFVEMENGQQLKADLVLLGIGVRPNVKLAGDSGLQVDQKMGIHVDDYMRTSAPHIFAAGDCTRKRCFLTGKASMVRLASIATMEGRVAAGNLFNCRRRAPCPIGVFGTVIGKLAVGSAGFTERAAEREGIEVVVGTASAMDKHPGTLPGAEELTVKLIFMKGSRELIGGQVYGSDKAGYVVNCIGGLIQQRMRADEICVFQMGTHPKLTPSPIAHQIENAAEMALAKDMKR